MLKLFPFQYNKADEPLELEVEMASEDTDQPKRKLSSWRHQRLGYVFDKATVIFGWSARWNTYFRSVFRSKVNSEYRAKFLSPAQYLYKAGAWTRMKENVPNQVSLPTDSNSMPDSTLLIVGSNWQCGQLLSKSFFTINYLIVSISSAYIVDLFLMTFRPPVSQLKVIVQSMRYVIRRLLTVCAIAAWRKGWVSFSFKWGALT